MEVGQTVGGLSWEKFDGADDYVEEIRRSCGVSEFLAKCLASLEPRFESMEEVRAFLSPSMSDYFDPYLMKGMAEAVARLRRAISAHEHIRIVTDYDADGTMSMLILKAMLKILKHAEQTHYIPNRQEHYGFSLMAAQKAVEDGVELIVTADIGVKDEAAIGYAQSHGVDVIVLDHHLPDGGGVPRAAYVVVCPPQEGCTYPNPHLAACGISLKLAQAMLADNKYYARIIASMSKMAALGTVADVVSLRNIENRAIVATGLAALNEMKGNNAGVNALLNASGARLGAIRSEDVSFRLAPLINAAGRMASAMHVIDLIEAPQISIDMFNKTLDKNSRIKTFKCQKLHIHRSQPGVIHYDGDPVMTGEEIDVEIRPKGIKIIVNPFADRNARKPNAIQSAAAELFNQINEIRDDINRQGRRFQAWSKLIQRKLNL